MNGPFSFYMGNYPPQKTAPLPASGPVFVEPETKPAVKSLGEQSPSAPTPASESQESNPAYGRILDFVRNVRSQLPTSGNITKGDGAKKMENTGGSYVPAITNGGYDPMLASAGYDPTLAGGGYDPMATSAGYDPMMAAGNYGDTGYQYNSTFGLYMNPATGEFINPYDTTTQTETALTGGPTAAAPVADPTAAAPLDVNTDPSKMGDGSNDRIVISDKKPETGEAEYYYDEYGNLIEIPVEETQEEYLTSATDVLDPGTGQDEVTIEQDGRKGTIRLADFGGMDAVSIKSKNNDLIIETDSAKGADGKPSDVVLLAGMEAHQNPDTGEWGPGWRVEKGQHGTAVYTEYDESGQVVNKVTVKGKGQVIFSDGTSPEDPNAVASNKSAVREEVLELADHASAEEIAKEIQWDNLSEVEKDYVAMSFLLKVDNKLSGADEDSGFLGIGKDDLEDDDYSEDDMNRIIESARKLGNEQLAQRIEHIRDAIDNKDLRRWDGDADSGRDGGEVANDLFATIFTLGIASGCWSDNDDAKRPELETIKEAIKTGLTINKMTEKTQNM
ncbi:MAG TPA: hypothetical protein V6C99_02000 [Oculatellaceae cyanobacterium]|jgi:hypothetical protein